MTAISASAQGGGKVLVLVGHPDMEQSKANKAMVNAIKDIPGVRIMDVYAEEFALENYRQAVKDASVLVMQFPFYWASAPSEMKRWQDEIFMHLMEEVAGKKMMVATTTGSEYDAYRSGGRNGYTMDELLRPYQLSANVAQMEWLTPFVLYQAGDDNNVKTGAAKYSETIRTLLK